MSPHSYTRPPYIAQTLMFHSVIQKCVSVPLALLGTLNEGGLGKVGCSPTHGLELTLTLVILTGYSINLICCSTEQLQLCIQFNS